MAPYKLQCLQSIGSPRLCTKSCVALKIIYTDGKRKRLISLILSLLNVNIKLDSLRTHLEAMSLSLQYKRTLNLFVCCAVDEDGSVRLSDVTVRELITADHVIGRRVH